MKNSNAQWMALSKNADADGSLAKEQKRLKATRIPLNSSAVLDLDSAFESRFVLTRLGDLAGWGEVLLDAFPQFAHARTSSRIQFDVTLAQMAKG